MDKLIERKFTTSEFAKMHNINKKTLMYYDNIGLFSPAEVKENGYRYYTFAQNFALGAILLLRKLHVPLKEIKRYLDNYTQETLLELLQMQDSLIDEQLNELLWLKKITQTKIENLTKKKKIDFEKIKIVQQKERAILVSQNLENLSLEAAIPLISGFIRNCYQTKVYQGNANGIIADANLIRQHKQKKLVKFFYQTDDKTCTCFEREIIPAGRYLVAYYKGSWRTINDFYDKIIKYADKHKLVFDQYTYEEKLLDDMAAEDFDYTELKFSVRLQ